MDTVICEQEGNWPACLEFRTAHSKALGLECTSCWSHGWGPI